jgi:hypothetical protein
LLLLIIFSDEIVVNTEYPERNREVMISHYPDADTKIGTVVNAYKIAINQADCKDVEMDYIEAYQVSENQILIQMASCDRAFLQGSFPVVCAAVEKAHKVTRNGCMDEEGDRGNFKYMLLTFPNHQELDPKPFMDPTTIDAENYDGDMELEGAPFKVSGTIAGSNVTNEYTRVYWTVGIKEARTCYTKKAAKPKKKRKKGIDLLTGKMTGMAIS